MQFFHLVYCLIISVNSDLNWTDLDKIKAIFIPNNKNCNMLKPNNIMKLKDP